MTTTTTLERPAESGEAHADAQAATVSLVGRADGDRWAVLAGVRFVLALIVVCHHLVNVAPDSLLDTIGLGNGMAAVVGFFAISGYSMAHSLTRESGGLRFYERRFWRIYPCYLFAITLAAVPLLLFATVFTHAAAGYPNAPTRREFLQAAMFLQGFTMPGTLPANGVVWSLSIEVWLYALCPLFLKLSPRALVGIMAASIALNYAHPWINGQTYNETAYGLAFVSLAWTFLLGFALYRYRDALTAERFPLVLVAALAAAAVDTQSNSEYFGPAVFAGVLAALYYAPRAALPRRWVKPLLWLGDLSYCLYLVHVPVLDMAQGFGCRNGFVIVSACLALAALTLHCIDYPVRAYRRRVARVLAA